MRRRGVAAVELAFLLPFLAFLFVIGLDWARVFYYSETVANCARNGAQYAADPYNVYASPYTSVTQAALADASNLSPTPRVDSDSGSDAFGSYVEVTVTYPFTTVTNFPGVPANTNVVSKVRMYIAPATPKF
jgi:Flp pilus assembly protein TadG